MAASSVGAGCSSGDETGDDADDGDAASDGSDGQSAENGGDESSSAESDDDGNEIEASEAGEGCPEPPLSYSEIAIEAGDLLPACTVEIPERATTERAGGLTVEVEGFHTGPWLLIMSGESYEGATVDEVRESEFDDSWEEATDEYEYAVDGTRLLTDGLGAAFTLIVPSDDGTITLAVNPRPAASELECSEAGETALEHILGTVRPA